MTRVNKKYSFLKPLKIPNLVRLGRNADGGYVVDLNIIKKSNTLISFGMGSDWSFELDCIKKNKDMKIYIYDYSTGSCPYIKEIWKYFRRFITLRVKYQDLLTRVKYFCRYLKFLNLKNVVFLKKKITYPKKNKNDIDVDDVFIGVNIQEKVVIKSDIEGSEYKIIDQILKYSTRVEMLVFEFHFIDVNEKIFFESVKKLQEFFNIIHIHGNNHGYQLDTGIPCHLEITFLNKKYSLETHEHLIDFPIKELDYPNNPYKEDLFFSFTED